MYFHASDNAQFTFLDHSFDSATSGIATFASTTGSHFYLEGGWFYWIVRFGGEASHDERCE